MSTVLILDDPTTVGILDVIVADNLGAGELTDDGFLTTHGDASATLGAVLFSGTVGSFNVFVSAGITDPLIPVGAMDLFSSFLSTDAGALNLMFTTTDVDLGTGIAPARFDFGGNTGGTISAQAMVDPDGREFGFGGNPQTVGTLGPFSGTFDGTSSTPVPVSDDSSLTITVDVAADGAGQLTGFDAFLGVDVPDVPLAMLGDFVWEDLNANGIQDPDELDDGINGVEVKLLADTDDDGEIDDVVATQLTTNNPDNGLAGWYKFNGLTPGVEYQVMFNNPDDEGPDAYMFSPRQVGGDPAVDSDGPMSDVVVLSSGEFNDTIDAGLFRKGSIHVFGYEDMDGDGNFDPEDGAFPDDPGKTFELLDENGDVIETQTTMDGMVWFEQLTPGTYSVRENPIPDGFDLTTLPNERTFTIISGEELVYEDGAAMLPEGDQRFETNLGDDLRWGNTELAMLGDFVWEDLNANGIQDPDELDDGINGVEVKLLADTDDDGEIDDVVATQLTTNNPDNGLAGWYKFNGLTPGVEYQVMFNNPDDEGPDAYMFSPRQVGGDPAVDSDGPMSDVVVLSSGEFNDTIDAGLFRKGSIHVFGYEDMDGDGNFDPEDGAFPDDPGKTFELLDENGDVIETQTTMDGMVWFEQLTPGTYSVRENPIPDGFDLTTLPNERTFTIISGEELVYEDGAAMLPEGDQRFETNLGDDLRWGNTELAMLGDFVWEDLNANGIQDPDELDDGINGVEVKLLADTNDDGTPDTVVDTQFTTNNPDGGLAGYYKFNGLTPGVEYQVMFNNPDPDGDDAYMFSPRQVGGDPAIDSDGPMSDVVVLSSGEFNDTIDAGLFRKGSIHVFGYEDMDGDGNFDPEDGAFPDDPGKTFELLDENGDVIMTDSTMDGMVWFEQLLPGTYTVRENPIPDGFALTTLPNQRTFTIISGQELVYEDGAAMLPDGDQRFETNLGDDLRWGNTELAMLGDFVWEDLNANGIQDPDELDDGINGVEVKLLADTNDDGTPDTVVDTQFTTNNPDGGLAGYYKFNGLTPGVEYQVMFNNPDPDGPDAYMFSPRQVGGDPAVDSDGPMSDVVVLSSGEFNDTIDAGLFRKGSIHVFGFEDVNADGFYEEGVDVPWDQNLPGKKIDLFNADGIFITSQLTNADGEAWFENLTPGTYMLQEDLSVFPDDGNGIIMPSPAPNIPDGPPGGAAKRTVEVTSGQELVWRDGAAMLPDGDQREEVLVDDGSLVFGNFIKGSVHGIKYNDLDGDGIQDDNEPGVEGVTFVLSGSNAIGAIAIETTTDANGEFWFTDLIPGSYRVTETVPEGSTPTTPTEVPVTVVSGVEYVAVAGQAMLQPGQEEIILDQNNDDIPDLAFGNFTPEPDVDLEKFVRVDTNPLNIVKLVGVDPMGADVQDLCFDEDGNKIGKPEAMTFLYNADADVNKIDTNQAPGKVVYVDGFDDSDGDGNSFILVTDKEDASADDARVFFSGNVMSGDTYTASSIIDGTEKDFKGSTYIHIFDEADGPLLQSVEFHTSCSQPLTPGDQYGSSQLVGGVLADGTVVDPQPVFEDANEAPGPEAMIGSTVVFRYEVTNTGDTAVENVVVTDDRLTGVEFVEGDTNEDGLLDPTETWIYTASETAEAGLQTNKGTATGTSANGQTLMAMDPANYTGVETPPFEGDVCDELGKPVELTFNYLPGTDVITDQDDASATGTPDDDGESFIVVTDRNKVSDVLAGEGNVYFSDDVLFDEEFAASAAEAGEDRLKSNTFIYVFDDLAAFNAGNNPLQTMRYHTSCSQPIQLGDVIGSVTLVGYTGEDGSAALPPPAEDSGGADGDEDTSSNIMLEVDDTFDPDNIGEDADIPTGPVAEEGDIVTFTYKVTNTGNVDLTITSLFDDNETPPLPPGTGDDDFEPAPVLKDNGNNFGDDNDDGLLNPGEMWFFQAKELATDPGLHTNIAKVTAEDEVGTMVMDDDPANYIINPLNIVKLVGVDPMGGDVQDLCFDEDGNKIGKPEAMTFLYNADADVNKIDTNQAPGKVVYVDGFDDSDGDGNSFILVTDKEDASADDARVFFSGNVTSGMTYTASSIIDGTEKDFKGSTYIHIFDEADREELLQSVEFHTSCSQPLTPGDQYGSSQLVGGVLADGTVVDPQPVFEDANEAPGPEALVGSEVLFRYEVTNSGDTALANVDVTDDRLTGVTFVEGDTNEDGLLDPTETWIYTASETAEAGLHTNKGTVVGNPVDENGDPIDIELMDMDPANYTGVETPPFEGDVCDAFGKPVALTFDYEPGSDVDTGQEDASATGTPDGDGESFIVVTDRNKVSDVLDGEGKIYFSGIVLDDEEFTASAAEAGDDRLKSNTFIYVFDDEDAFDAGNDPLQIMRYHTSCSQPIELGDVIGSVELVGYEGEDGSVEDMNLFG